MNNRSSENESTPLTGWRQKMNVIIFGTDTLMGKTFDIILLIVIILSILTVMLESVESISIHYGEELKIVEWIFTIMFSIEYIARIIASPKPFKYIFSYLGMIDFLAITPTFLNVFFKGSHAVVVIRSIRLIRIFRILKLARYMGGARTIYTALRASIPKVVVFLVAVVSLTIILGTFMYLFEGNQNEDFSDIPTSIYWAIVTLTTVGYGDIIPITILGKVMASVIMILGYGIIAVPTGIVTGEFIHEQKMKGQKACRNCHKPGHDADAKFCKYCGEKIGD
jgi:voltage-gated potassium channel